MHAFAKRSVPLVLSQSITAVCLFGSAGRLNWWNGWLLIGLSFLGAIAATVVIWRDPGLVIERRNLKAGKSWDKAIVAFVVFLGPVAMWITAGLDARHRWSPSLPTWTVAAGVVVAALGVALMAWAMGTNKFFSAVVRIQKDRGHTVVTGGPYQFVRHPGYAGMAAFTLATPLILGSWWAYVPAAATAAVTMLRTALEDRTLQNELEGYPDYARTVRYKLIPIVW